MTHPTLGESVIAADDPRYESLLRGTNHRFVAKPDYVRVVTTTDEVVAAVGAAVAAGKRIAVRSGGHGFESFTTADIQVLLDMSEMTEVRFDADRSAFSVQPGATLGHVYRVLFKGWNVTIPAGECPEVGVGGHFSGGGYGPLSRSLGAVVDYICAVEVVVVDESGAARAVVATNDPGDENHELWWAFTGGGGGNIGVVTRFWLRKPGVESGEPHELLPTAPSTWRSGFCIWPWEQVTEEVFTRVFENFGRWFEENSGAGSEYAPMSGFLHVCHKSDFGLTIGCMIDNDTPDAERLIDGYFDAVSEGVGGEPMRSQNVKPWLYFSAYPNWGDPGTPDARRIKIKAAYHRKGYTAEQIATIWRHLTTEERTEAQLIAIGYGGQVNTVAPDATATAQRDSILKVAYMSVWAEEEQDQHHIGQLREFYRDVYARTGGVPVPGEHTDGSYINYADADLADPELNTSGVPWHTLYYKDNYPRLQQAKLRYDPKDVFRHVLSIQLPR
jgi:hypothetical protein